ncbi:hypothetical protein ADMFC3_00240 [Geovibrio sp. ADMFC3]
MTVREIVAEWLKNNGYDGLVDIEGECVCLIEDLIPCDCEHIESCQAGKRVLLPECMECDTFCLSIKEVTMCDYKEEAGDYVFED